MRTLPILLIALAPPAAGQIVPARGLADFQVLQRGADGKATASFHGSCAGTGVVEAAVRHCGQLGEVLPWTTCGVAADGAFEAQLAGLPTGGPYDIQLRIDDAGNKLLDTGVVRAVLVGDLWILAGQSNMEGCGILARGAEPPSRLVHVFDLADRWLVAREPLHWKWESVDEAHTGPPGPELEKRRADARKHRWRGGGLGLPFARAMVERTGVPVGLLTCALGGTRLEQWSPARKAEGGRSLYGSLLRRVQACGGAVRGALWYQGEADAIEKRASDYAARFAAFVAALREDLSAPALPFYYVQLGRYLFLDDQDQWTLLRQAQLESETLIPPPVGMVTAIDQPLVDAIHVRTRGLATIGRRLALLASRDVEGRKDLSNGPRPLRIESLGGYPQRVVITFAGANGGLRCKGRLTGFSIRDEKGTDLRMIFDQFLDPEREDRVILECQVTWGYKPLPEGAFVHYGWGNDPYCNLEDAAGLAAPAFGPWKLPLPKR